MDLPSKKTILFILLSILLCSITVQGQIRSTDQKKIMIVRASAYCHYGKPPCTKGKYKGKTTSGILVRKGVIAVDRKVIKLGSVVEVVKPEAYKGFYIAADTGGSRIKGNFIDVWFPTYKESMNFGLRKLELRILPEDEAKEKRKEILNGNSIIR